MSKPFKSSAFVFRPTSLAAALVRAGSTAPISMVREPVARIGNRVLG